VIRAALTAPAEAEAEADEWAAAGVGGAAAGSAAAALPTAPTGVPAGCCGRRGFAAWRQGRLLLVSLLPPSLCSWRRTTTGWN